MLGSHACSHYTFLQSFVDCVNRYQVNIPKADGPYIVLALSNDSSMSLQLPVGDKDNLYNLRMTVYVIDSLAATTRVNISVIVSFSFEVFLFDPLTQI